MVSKRKVCSENMIIVCREGGECLVEDGWRDKRWQQDKCKVVHNYYQWVPYILVLQVLPYLVWLTCWSWINMACKKSQTKKNIYHFDIVLFGYTLYTVLLTAVFSSRKRNVGSILFGTVLREYCSSCPTSCGGIWREGGWGSWSERSGTLTLSSSSSSSSLASSSSSSSSSSLASSSSSSLPEISSLSWLLSAPYYSSASPSSLSSSLSSSISSSSLS